MEQIGTVTVLEGSATAVSSSGERNLSEGSPVFKGETVSTGADSSISIGFTDDSVLSQGEDSTISLDEYVYDQTDPSSSKAVFNMTKGVFRMVTGEIVKAGVDDVTVQTPLSVIGIRGTTTVHQILGNLEKHGVESITIGSQVTITDTFGNTRTIDLPQQMVEVFTDMPSSQPRGFSAEERELFNRIRFETGDEQGGDEDVQAQDAGNDQTGDDETPETGTEQQDAPQPDAAEDGEEEVQPEFTQVDTQQFLFTLFGVESWEEFGNLISQALAEPEDFVSPEEENNDDEIIPPDDGGEEPSGSSLTGTSGNDSLVGTSNSDTISGLCGDDTILGLGGWDYIDGGEGNDSIVGGGAEHTDDWDTVLYTDATGGVVVDLLHGTATGAYGDDTLSGITDVEGSEYDDSIFGDSASSNWLFGNGGNDTIFTGGGDDDWITGNAGDDYLVANGGTSNELDGGDGNDILQSMGGDDLLSGDAGDDILDGGAGADTLNGRVGNDRFDFEANDVESGEVINGGTGDDTLNVIGSTDFRLAEVDNLENLALGGGQSASFYADQVDGETANLFGNTGGSPEYVQIYGTSSGEMLDMTGITPVNWDSNNYIEANMGQGNDSIWGTSGKDKLHGECQDDFLYGGSGADSLYGGNDPSTGGNDTFYYHDLGSGSDYIGDFGDDSGSAGGEEILLFYGPNFGFSGSGTLSSMRFASNDYGGAYNGMATYSDSSSPGFVYDWGSGELWYDPDGSAQNSAEELIAVIDDYAGNTASISYTNIEITDTAMV